jgi:hypothetical protein
MSERIYALAQRLFGKATIEECNLEEVKSLAQRFPYFAPAQFLLLEKLNQVGSEEYSAQLQKSILYYHNPLEFQYFISSDRFYTEVLFDETAEEPGDNVQEANEEDLRNEEQEIGVETKIVINDPEIVKTQTEEDECKEPLEQNTVVPSAQTEIITEEQQVQTPNIEPVVEEQPLTPNTELQTPNPQPETALTFEPYHTVDYFASQGIKLSQEEIPKDKFGKQLKSFTEWLKTMKRLPPTQITSSAGDASSENKVQHLADDSIHESDVWTEAMAEVWIKQGNTQKAIETYNKLVLLNPSKKTYFATKIENLKRF